MNNQLINLKKKFDDKGYFVFLNFIKENVVSKLIEEINSSKNTIRYYDNHNNLRRIEKLYDKGPSLKNLNNEILTLLKIIFNKDFLIFKDKFNAKPPGGEGFFAHYDGIFNFIDQNNKVKRGWYEYGTLFINVLVALDKCSEQNGTIEIANFHNGSFEDLLKNTKKDGTPALTNEIEKKLSFEKIYLNIGDIVIFSNTCPHRSKKNLSSKNRRILYYTYSLKENGSKYEIYFNDKENSKNTSKALSEK